MPKFRISVLDSRPILDIASYARKGPGRRDRLSPAEVAQISRTVRRAPEVMVKVLQKGSNDASAVAKHIGYIGRYGQVALETDEGEQLQGRDAGRTLLEDWDLDLDEHRRTSELTPGSGRPPPKLVHKLMLSMPAGTPPKAVLAAARNFLREEFALKHRYAFVLHTDEPHPHVHAVVKAVSEQGVRLNIRKATLRRWRAEFARHLREQGIEANATERAVRGESRTATKDGIFRASLRGASIYASSRAAAVAAELLKGGIRAESGKKTLIETRTKVVNAWLSVAEYLAKTGNQRLADDICRFAKQMPPVRTEKDLIAQAVLKHVSRENAIPIRS